MCGADSQDTNASTRVEEGHTLVFPEHLYAQLTDAHCHIQDDRENIHQLSQSWLASTSKGSKDNTVPPLLTGKVCLMGVQPSKDLGLVSKGDSSIIEGTASLSVNASILRGLSSTPVVTVTWNDTDTMGDWDLVSKLAHDHPDRVVPCFGIHPWFAHKYKPLEPSSSSLRGLELRGVSPQNGPSPIQGADSTTSTTKPLLSFSSTSLTPVPGPGVRREAFLAMSKQLQEQMAKESREKEERAKAALENHQQEQNSKEERESTNNIIADNNAQQQQGAAGSHHHPNYAHYQKVLSLPSSAPATYLDDLAKRLPEPRALEPALKELRRQLEAHPHAILGEVGLDRTARVPEPSMTNTVEPVDSAGGIVETETGGENDRKEQKRITLALTSIQHQLEIVREQLKLAASLSRPVSFHCVQAYGHWHDFLIQEGRRMKQIEADHGYQLQLEQIRASGGAVTISPVSPSGIRLSNKYAARLRKEARDAAWERHVASTLHESSDEEEEEEEEEEEDMLSDGGQENTDGREESKKKMTEKKADNSTDTRLTANTSNEDLTEVTVKDSLNNVPLHEVVLPPRLCMHSYGGSTDMIKAFTKMDHPPEIFFSFSMLINGRLQERKLRELILAVPEDRLLIESDHHSHTHVDQLLVEMVHKIAEIRKWSIEETVQKTARNWRRFVYG
ncbi:hypothetical protein BX616_008844 [Lobosporangium transversale]|uniref:Cut9 interacting protein Scn1 n=1 Tax=Lobosporangium transversale TaxID=64571 RepID=A0A1Y2G6Q8_9FUNG|nr:hypothetical protein BCR41DRAFT_364260 [Lobosporangium transversale]KAF9914162.1 hypothetical protein BX616_008844 [Lobosporangium transversale]ORY98390.1 hypothetical protein BCR41DRAFT_364260 [Lobosporangium transversale]|eukprot:XP_021875782.1 hypothetical protein BCR41DRAFT_364260 [Lobosporangium transversale]